MCKKMFKTMTGLVLVFAMLLSVGMVAHADLSREDNLNLARTGALTVTPRSVEEGNPVVAGMQFTIYRVARITVEDNQLAYILTDDFLGTDADLSDLTDATLVSTFETYAEEHDIEGITATADDAGTVNFEDIPLGLYLVVQSGMDEVTVSLDPDAAQAVAAAEEAAALAGEEYLVKSFLVSVPMMAEDGTAWNYYVDASPKTEAPERIDISVKKVWDDFNDAASLRPNSIVVQLYRGDLLLDTQNISLATDWEYTWTNLPKSDEYTVVEVDVTGYQVTITDIEDAEVENGYAFTITNTLREVPPWIYENDRPVSPAEPVSPVNKVSPDTPQPTRPVLAQTGQLNWPVPVLAAVGVVFFGFGWGLTHLGKNKEE